ncbi:MAG: PDZ domain-containing protein [Streptosporangiaceae bacterium]
MSELPKPAAPEEHVGTQRRAVTLGVVSVLVLGLGLVSTRLAVPYVALKPGPTMNTIGTSDVTKKPLIEITGHPVYPDDGHLNFTTVAYTGGPEHPLDLYSALRDWLNSDTAVVPEETIFPKGETVKQVEDDNTLQMADSQETAVAAALTQLKQPISTVSAVQTVQKDLPAEEKLKPGDEILAVDGVRSDRTGGITAEMKKHKAGDTVTLTIRRDGREQDVKLTTVASPQAGAESRPVIGVVLRDHYKFPFSVKISVGDIGGPSAGLMFSLGIYDLLTPGTLTGGRFIAGTGTITTEGQVGPIGGIQQKMIAARRAGAAVFLVPPGNCAEAKGAAPGGLKLVKAETLDSAVKALEAVHANAGAVLPGC